MPLRDFIKNKKIAYAALYISSLFAIGFLVTGCATQSPEQQVKSDTIESAGDKLYGVTPTPKPISSHNSILNRSAGRSLVGKPYRVRGQWYYPKEDKQYSKIGHASWYGSTFHGRLTANGETYDMNHLTAAHPTMPLPSYARVTNLENGSSVIVRVNDRGPYAKDRIIDLSKRAALMLDYKESGTANVKVEYVGRAPVETNDDDYLLASYKPSSTEPNLMLALNDPISNDKATQKDPTQQLFTTSNMPILPEIGPIIEQKPEPPQWAAYADERKSPSKEEMFEGLLKPQNIAYQNDDSIQLIEIGVFKSKELIEPIYKQLKDCGHIQIETVTDKNDKLYHLTLSGFSDADLALQKAWNSGAQDAFIVRN